MPARGAAFPPESLSGDGQTHEDLVQEVLDELLFERPARQETVEVGTEELGDKVDVFERRDEDVGERDDVLVLDVLQELELSVRALGEDGSACKSQGRSVKCSRDTGGSGSRFRSTY